MLKFGIVGIGTHAGAVVYALEKTAKSCELAAACDLRENDCLKELGRQGVATFTDFDKMLQTAGLDALYVCTTSASHYEIVKAALRAGLHVICEKPMSDTVEKCELMIQEAEKAKRKLAITFENRYHPEIRKMKEWIDAGRLGRVEAFHVHYFTSAYKPHGPMAARRKRLLDLAGVLDCGIHALDYIRHLSGGEWEDVCARGAWFGEPLANAPHLSVLGSLSNGAMATVTYSYAYAAYIDADASNQMEMIIGTDGVVEYVSDAAGPAVMKLVSKTLTEEFPVEYTGHNLAIGWLADDFADVVEGRKEWPPELASGYDGLAAQKVMEEALAQARAKSISK